MHRIPQASALPDPQIQVTHFVESVQTRTGPQENVIMLSQRVPWFGTLGSRRNSASLQAEALWFAYQNQQLALSRMVALAFYEYGYTREATRLTRENRDLLRTLEPVVEEKVQAGAELNALLRLKVEIGKVDDRLRTLQQKRLSLSAKLCELLGLSDARVLPWPQWEAPGDFTPDTVLLMEAVMENNPELQMLQRKIASGEAREEIARLESYPNITLGLNYIQIGDPVVNTTMAGGGQDAWGVTVGINIPLWRGKYKAARNEAAANRRSLESEFEDRLNSLKAEITSSLATLGDANRRLKLYGAELLGLARQAVENSRTSYEGGRTGILEVIDSERSLLDLQLIYWRAAADAWQQRIIIQTIANQPIPEIINTSHHNE
jgi:outer membrane protein TolC